jgi:hypothetical protein
MNQPDDVKGVREVLKHLGYYNGPMSGPVDENDPNDPTVLAIKALQGGLKTKAWTLDIEKSPALTSDQIKARLIPGA